MTDEIRKKLFEIAKRNIVTLKERTDLEQKHNDDKDFFTTTVWSLEDALKEAYQLGQSSIK
ncbi:MAG TPA: hypothetical protein VIL26_04100 [Clostridia bacterium]